MDHQGMLEVEGPLETLIVDPHLAETMIPTEIQHASQDLQAEVLDHQVHLGMAHQQQEDQEVPLPVPLGLPHQPQGASWGWVKGVTAIGIEIVTGVAEMLTV